MNICCRGHAVEYVPTVQFWHVLEALARGVSLHVPGGHRSQLVWASFVCRPAAQGEHAVAAAAALIVPTAQSTQARPPASLLV